MVAARLTVFAVACAMLAAPTAAMATSARDAEKGYQHYKKGGEHFARGEYDQAVAELVLAIGYERKPIYLWNIARAYEKKGDLQNARVYYEKYRAIAPSAAEKKEADGKIMALERLEAERMAKGKLVVAANVDGAEVTIDTKPAGETPIGDFIELTIGEHRVELAKDGYEPYATTVRIEGGMTQTVQFEMVPIKVAKTGTLKLTITEMYALARLDGEPLGTGPFTRRLAVPVGKHELTVQKEGFLPFVHSLSIAEGEETPVAPELVPVPSDAETSETMTTWGWVLVAVGGVAVGAGTYLLIDPPIRETRTETQLIQEEQMTPGGTLVGVGGAAVATGIILLALAPEQAATGPSTSLWLNVQPGVAPRLNVGLSF